MSSNTSASGDARSSSSKLSNRQTVRALRDFIISGTFWGAWIRVVGIGVSTFTGYALWLGATEPEIAYFVSIASFTSLAQVLSSPIFNRLRLEDASPEVRRQAARGLREAPAPEAVSHLLDELRNEESDIRTEAVEALGKIGDPAVIDPLIEALEDDDFRIQISAITTLSNIGGNEVSKLFFWKFTDRFDRATFPPLPKGSPGITISA